MSKAGWGALIGVPLLLLAACGHEEAANNSEMTANVAEAASNEAAPAPEPEYYTDLPIREFMYHVVQYTADGVWSRQGWIADKDGERSLFPATDEEWEKAESAALTLAELTNLLQLPGRKIDDGQWLKSTEEVRKVALEAAKAAEKHDQAAFFEAGGKLDTACESCHVAYIPDYIGPGTEAANAN